MYHNFLNKLPHDFRCQFPNIGIPVHNCHETVGIQHGVFSGMDFLFQLLKLLGKFLPFCFIVSSQFLKLYFGQVLVTVFQSCHHGRSIMITHWGRCNPAIPHSSNSRKVYRQILKSVSALGLVAHPMLTLHCGIPCSFVKVQ